MESLPKFLICHNPLYTKGGTFIFHTEAPQFLAEILKDKALNVKITPVWISPIMIQQTPGLTEAEVEAKTKENLRIIIEEMGEYIAEVELMPQITTTFLPSQKSNN